ncbi:hypothetical protein [Pseudoalteromonas luteoviolacea]|uniref:hypothetical protein n=1 Tax=Pseudoalteromonas luteoviolacea TaxID=43657 RepID=UPI0011530CA9|nr:hypothetical protein [Pseudoalteromonas luteoviolacea]TQF70197.1 hypothetical protein FLM44_03655 [Pseudoalteromonas luteoviolacea]
MQSSDVAGVQSLTDSEGNSYYINLETGIAELVFEAGNGTTSSVCPECYLGGVGAQRFVVGMGYRVISAVTRSGAPTYRTFAMGSTARDIWKIMNLSPRLISNSKSFFRVRYYWNKSGGNFDKAVRSLGTPNSGWDKALIPTSPLSIGLIEGE